MQSKSHSCRIFAALPLVLIALVVNPWVQEAVAQTAVFTGASVGGGPRITGRAAPAWNVFFNQFSFESEFRGGTQMAFGDLNGDGVDELIAGPGPGGGPRIRIFDGNEVRQGRLAGQLANYFMADSNDRGGINLASGDINCDGKDDVVGVMLSPSYQATFAAWSGATLSQGNLANFANFSLFPGQNIGANVAIGKINSDCYADLIYTADVGGGPVVGILDGAALSQGQRVSLGQFFAFPEDFRGGVRVAAADINGDGYDDIITAPGAGGGAIVRVFDGKTRNQIFNQCPYNDCSISSGMYVAGGDLNGDGKAEIITGLGSGTAGYVNVLDGAAAAGNILSITTGFGAYEQTFTGGIWVAYANLNPRCRNGRDDDGDGRTDYPQDPGCTSPDDADETDAAAVPPTVTPVPPTPVPPTPIPPACSDGKDNDLDRKIDFPADPGCSSASDTDEKDLPACSDGKDSDSDGKTDFPADPGCTSATDTDEADVPACKDGKDNDGDGKTDYPRDPGCSSATDTDEADVPACSDGKDNDGDKKIDFPNDPGCSSATDTDEKDLPACMDGKDNDSDGKTDWPADPGCNCDTDTDETDLPACKDGLDNDGDGKIDYPRDLGCNSPTDTDEVDLPACSDGKDNDRDGKIDFPNDLGCTSASDTDEKDLPACSDGRDNDADGKIDFPADPGCFSAKDTDEKDLPVCKDGKDNDGDGKIDYPKDPGCSSTTDTDETDTPACSDGKDNDRDGKIDFPNDPGCTSATDTDEKDVPQCKDGLDNDGDGRIDFPTDLGCTSATDDDETEPPIISPVLECVYKASDSQYYAYFGYDSADTQSVTFEAGLLDDDVEVNSFGGDFPYRGQPDVFEPGRKIAAFTVKFDGTPIEWQVRRDGTSQIFSAKASKDSTRCAPIKPIVGCIDQKIEGGFVARFGYQNDNPFPIKISVGARNQFLPDPTDRGQPTTFLNGNVTNAVEAAFKSGNVTWQLDDLTAVANTASPLCRPNAAPTCSAGTPYQLTCGGPVTQVFLDGSASKDTDGTPITYAWTSTCAGTLSGADSAKPTIQLSGPGAGVSAACTVTLEVFDGLKATSCTQNVQVAACVIAPVCSAGFDACGVCGGKNTCLDCAGTPNGSARIDKCGVCGGTDKCLDCAGTVNGTSKLDRCGICGGDGLSCLGCTTTSNEDLLLSLDAAAKEQEANVQQLLKRLSRLGKKDASVQKFISKTLGLAQQYSTSNWTLAYQVPLDAKSCTNTTVCSTSDNSAIVDEYLKNADKLRDLVGLVARRLAAYNGGVVRGADKRFVAKADKEYDETKAITNQVPRFQSNC